MIKFSDFFTNVVNDVDYQSLNSTDKNLFETYYLLGELLDPNNFYQYKEEKIRNLWTYNDIMENKFFIRLTYTPVQVPYFELKTGWLDKGKPRYDLPDNITAKDWDKRSNTVAKIYRDEVLPRFIKQNNVDILKIIPNDIKRYQFSIRLVNKFKNNNIKITENKPKEIIIQKIKK